jgi:hypothetical protein
MSADFITETGDGTFVAFAVVPEGWPDVEVAWPEVSGRVEVEPLHAIEGTGLVVAVEGDEAAAVEKTVVAKGRPATQAEVDA